LTAQRRTTNPSMILSSPMSTRTLGGSYIFHWDAHSKVMASYELIETENNDPDDNLFTLRYQFSF